MALTQEQILALASSGGIKNTAQTSALANQSASQTNVSNTGIAKPASMGVTAKTPTAPVTTPTLPTSQVAPKSTPAQFQGPMINSKTGASTLPALANSASPTLSVPSSGSIPGLSVVKNANASPTVTNPPAVTSAVGKVAAGAKGLLGGALGLIQSYGSDALQGLAPDILASVPFNETSGGQMLKDAATSVLPSTSPNPFATQANNKIYGTPATPTKTTPTGTSQTQRTTGNVGESQETTGAVSSTPVDTTSIVNKYGLFSSASSAPISSPYGIGVDGKQIPNPNPLGSKENPLPTEKATDPNALINATQQGANPDSSGGTMQQATIQKAVADYQTYMQQVQNLQNAKANALSLNAQNSNGRDQFYQSGAATQIATQYDSAINAATGKMDAALNLANAMTKTISPTDTVTDISTGQNLAGLGGAGSSPQNNYMLAQNMYNNASIGTKANSMAANMQPFLQAMDNLAPKAVNLMSQSGINANNAPLINDNVFHYMEQINPSAAASFKVLNAELMKQANALLQSSGMGVDEAGRLSSAFDGSKLTPKAFNEMYATIRAAAEVNMNSFQTLGANAMGAGTSAYSGGSTNTNLPIPVGTPSNDPGSQAAGGLNVIGNALNSVIGQIGGLLTGLATKLF